MALYTGFLVGFSYHGPSSHIDLTDMGGRDPVNNSQRNGEYLVPTPIGTVRTDNTPISSIPVARRGVLAPTFTADWYGRVHIFPSRLDLGNLLASQTRDVEVWNGHFDAQLLSSIDTSGTDGITLTEPQVAPTFFAGIESRIYSLNISTNGSPVVDASYLFNFEQDTPLLAITGRRVVVWPFMPQVGHRETLEWKTDIIKSYQNEQRLALRYAPRQSFRHKFQLGAYQYSRAKAITHQWSQRVYGIPVWAELSYIGSLGSGAMEILVDTTTSDYRDNDIVLVWEDDENFSALETTTIQDDRVNLKLPLERSFTSAYIAPMRFGRTLSGVRFKRNPHDIVEVEATFTVTQNKDLASDMGLPTYRGKDVLNERTIILGEVSEKIARSMDLFDNGSGVTEVELNQEWITQDKTVNFDALNRETLWKYRGWLHYLRGKQGSFWVPSWNNDIEVVDDIGLEATTISIRKIGYPLYYGITDAMFVLTDGTVYYRRILNGVDNEFGGEDISIDSPFGVSIPKDNISFVSFMYHVRLDTDSINIQHGSAGRASINAIATETPE